MVNRLIFNNTALLNDVVVNGPNTIVCVDGIVSEVNPGFRSNNIRKDNIVTSLKIVFHVVRLSWTDDRVDIVHV